MYGHYPIQEDECLISNSHLFELGEGIDDVIDKYITVYLPSDDIEDSLKYSRYKIVGSFNSPEAMSKILGTSNLDNKELDTIILIKSSNFKSDYYTDIKVTYNDSFKYNAFKDDYKEYVDNCLDSLKDLAEEQKYICKNKIVDEALEEIHDGEKELAEEKEKGEKDLAKAKRDLNDVLKELKDGEQKIIDGEDEIAKNEQKIKDNESYLSSQSATVNSNIANIETTYSMPFNDVYSTINDAHNDYLYLAETKITHNLDHRFWEATLPPEFIITEDVYNSALLGLPDELTAAAIVDGTHIAYDQFVDGYLNGYDTSFGGSLETTYTGIKTLYDGRNAINVGYKQLSDGKKQIEDAKQTIKDNKKKIEDGWKDKDNGKEKQKESKFNQGIKQDYDFDSLEQMLTE